MLDSNIRLAATLMIVSSRHNVLMVRRNQNIAFAGGAYVFPGGRINPCDDLAGYNNFLANLESNSLEKIQSAAKIAAIRETFEETGILFAKDKDDNWVFDRFAHDFATRKKIESNPEYFFEFIDENSFSPATDNLAAIAIWQPPEHITKRFLTWFFIILLDEEIDAIPDGHEAVEAIWISPKDAHSDAIARQKHIIFPTRCNLALLAHYHPAQTLFELASSRSAPVINPRPQMINGEMMLCIPENIGYPEYCEPLANVLD